MTTAKIIVLMQVKATNSGLPLPRALVVERAAVVELIDLKLVETITEKLFLTEKGEVLTEMLLNTPMPVEMKVERWVDPRT